MAVDRSRGAADRSEAANSEAPGDPLSVPDYTSTADAPGDLPEVTGRSAAIRLGGSSNPPSAAADIDRLRDAARLEISAHREAAAVHLQAETEWHAARDPAVWEPPRKRYAEATSRVWVARHRALVALARLAAADSAECQRLCETSELEATVRDGETGWVTDLICQDRNPRALTGPLLVGVWTEPAEGDDGAS